MVVAALGDSPKGSKVCFQRQPRNICARIPKGKERSIHVQSISWVMTWKNRPKSSPLYIQYKIAPPRRMGNMILVALMKTVFNSMGAKIRLSEQKSKFIWDFSNVNIFEHSSKIVQIGRNTKYIERITTWHISIKYLFFTFFVLKCCLCTQTNVYLHHF